MNSKYQIGQKVIIHVFGKGQLVSGEFIPAVIEDIELDTDSEMYFVRFEAGNAGWVNVIDVREVA